MLSDIFNMKAYRVMYELLNDYELTPELLDEVAVAGLVAMFDGSEITEEALVSGWRGFGEKELENALIKVYDWYLDVKMPERDGHYVGRPPDNNVMGIYRHLLDVRGLSPSEVDKQCPQLLLDVMFADMGDIVNADDLTEEEKLYRGL